MPLFALSDAWTDHWTAIGWILAALCLVGSFLAYAIGRARRSRRIRLYGPLGVVLACVRAVPGWESFGWSTLYTDTGVVIRHHRWFGRVTRLRASPIGPGGGSTDCRYAFSDPWRKESEPNPQWVSCAEDRNGDGRRDTWFRPTGLRNGAGYPVHFLDADLDLAGSPDRRILAPQSPRLERGDIEYEAIREIRGF